MRKNQINILRGSRGMSLVELMLVLVIMSVVILAVMSLYVPALQSTAAQTQVSDVQSNLRLAVNRMSKDLIIAGFLVPVNPIIFEASTTPTTAENPDNSDFTIRTRAVGNSFARVLSAEDGDSTGDIKINVTNTAMAALFSDSSKVRLFEPMTATEINAGSGSDADRVYDVTGVDTAAGTIDIDPGAMSTSKADILSETVVLKVRDNSQPPVQTIRYRLVDGVLTREVNNNVQFLARNMDSVLFGYDFTPEGRVRRVDILLTGITRAVSATSGAKRRQVETSVSLRNVY